MYKFCIHDQFLVRLFLHHSMHSNELECWTSFKNYCFKHIIERSQSNLIHKSKWQRKHINECIALSLNNTEHKLFYTAKLFINCQFGSSFFEIDWTVASKYSTNCCFICHKALKNQRTYEIDGKTFRTNEKHGNWADIIENL